MDSLEMFTWILTASISTSCILIWYCRPSSSKMLFLISFIISVGLVFSEVHWSNFGYLRCLARTPFVFMTLCGWVGVLGKGHFYPVFPCFEQIDKFIDLVWLIDHLLFVVWVDYVARLSTLTPRLGPWAVPGLCLLFVTILDWVWASGICCIRPVINLCSRLIASIY